MGTNYYARTSATTHVDTPPSEGLHIGKYSAGWDFLFRAHPDLGLVDCEAWHTYLSQPGIEIIAEHWLAENLDKFWPFVTRRPKDVDGKMCVHAQEWMQTGILFPGPAKWIDNHGHSLTVGDFH